MVESLFFVACCDIKQIEKTHMNAMMLVVSILNVMNYNSSFFARMYNW